jgi:hypothetical protein
MPKIIVIGGGTFSHVRNHLSLCASAFGETARTLAETLRAEVRKRGQRFYGVDLYLTKMADPTSKLVTNEDVDKLLDKLIATLMSAPSSSTQRSWTLTAMSMNAVSPQASRTASHGCRGASDDASAGA